MIDYYDASGIILTNETGVFMMRWRITTPGWEVLSDGLQSCHTALFLILSVYFAVFGIPGNGGEARRSSYKADAIS